MEPLFLPKSDLYEDHYSIIKRTPDREFCTDIHYHDFYEIQVFFSSVPDTDLGSIFLADTEYPLKNGDLCLINLFTPHELKLQKDLSYERFCISISSGMMLELCSMHSELFGIFSCSNPSYPILHLNRSQQQLFLRTHRHFEQNYCSLPEGREFLEYAFIYEIIGLLYHFYYDILQTDPDTLHQMTKLTRLIQYIDSHLEEDLSLPLLSDLSRISLHHLCRVFKKHTGTTVNKYILTKRISRAKVLLCSNTPVQDISVQCGFHNYNHFYRSFKQLTGITPTDYRNQQFFIHR